MKKLRFPAAKSKRFLNYPQYYYYGLLALLNKSIYEPIQWVQRPL